MSIPKLVKRIEKCRMCRGLTHDSKAILNLQERPDVLFVGEVVNPANGQEVLPNSGRNTAGYYFHRLLQESKAQYDYCCTNAVLCPPVKSITATHLATCLQHLQAVIDEIQPYTVATLGRTALRQCCTLQDVFGVESYFLSGITGRPVEWYGRYLFPLTHPSGNAVAVKPFSAMLRDFISLREHVYKLQRKEDHDETTSTTESTDEQRGCSDNESTD